MLFDRYAVHVYCGLQKNLNGKKNETIHSTRSGDARIR